MKKAIFTTTLVFLAGLTFAQDEYIKPESPRKNIIKGTLFTHYTQFVSQENTVNRVTPQGFAIGFERLITEKTSWAIHLGSASSFQHIDALNQDLTYQIAMLSPQFRYYFTGKNMKGLYLGSNLNFGGVNMKLGDETASGGGAGFGLDLGYQWITKKHFTFELFLGSDFMAIGNVTPTSISPLYIPKTFHGPESGFRFGYNF